MKFLSFEEWAKLQPDDDNLNVCQFCRGDKEQTCLTCNGEGVVEREFVEGDRHFSCPDCDGEGFVGCSRCAGTGKDWRSKYNNEVNKYKATIKAWGTIAVQL